MESFCFTSSLFNIEPGEDEETNPYRYGKQLAYWIGDGLSKIGYSDVEIIPEDWGWCVMCSREPFMLWVGCGNMELMESLEDPSLFETKPIIWQCFVAAEKPFLKRLFGKTDTKSSEMRLQEQLGNLLRSETDIIVVDCL